MESLSGMFRFSIIVTFMLLCYVEPVFSQSFSVDDLIPDHQLDQSRLDRADLEAFLITVADVQGEEIEKEAALDYAEYDAIVNEYHDYAKERRERIRPPRAFLGSSRDHLAPGNGGGVLAIPSGRCGGLVFSFRKDTLQMWPFAENQVILQRVEAGVSHQVTDYYSIRNGYTGRDTAVLRLDIGSIVSSIVTKRFSSCYQPPLSRSFRVHRHHPLDHFACRSLSTGDTDAYSASFLRNSHPGVLRCS